MTKNYCDVCNIEITDKKLYSYSTSINIMKIVKGDYETKEENLLICERCQKKVDVKKVCDNIISNIKNQIIN